MKTQNLFYSSVLKKTFLVWNSLPLKSNSSDQGKENMCGVQKHHKLLKIHQLPRISEESDRNETGKLSPRDHEEDLSVWAPVQRGQRSTSVNFSLTPTTDDASPNSTEQTCLTI